MKLLLGSKSPRRSQLLQSLALDFETVEIDCEEIFNGIQSKDVALHLAQLKSNAYTDLRENELLITADTTVLLNDQVLNKPQDKSEALRMLASLQNNTHQVNTAVCLKSSLKEVTLSVFTDVHIQAMDQDEICFYVDHYQPFDKAGSYGIQEWLGLAKIDRIDGCYYNVMGLPCAELYETLKTHFPEVLEF